MINLTNEPQLINPKMGAVALNASIREAIRQQIIDEAQQLQCEPGVFPARDKFFQSTFGAIFSPELQIKRRFTAEWIVSAYSFALEPPPANGKPSCMDSILLKKRGNLEIASYNETTRRTSVCRGAPAVILTKRALRQLMLRLWGKGLITLPFTFDMGRETYRGEMLTPVAQFIAHHTHAEIRKRCLKVILTTDWHVFESIRLDELSRLHVLTLAGSENKLSSQDGRIPYVQMLNSFVEHYAGRLNFNKEDIAIYSRWTRGKHYHKYSYLEFSENFEQVLDTLQENAAQSRKKSSRKGNYFRRAGSENIGEIDFSKPVLHTVLENLAKEQTHRAAIEYFKICYGLARGAANTDPYPGRESVKLAKMTNRWFPVMSDYLDDRIKNGYEGNELHSSNLCILCDYLCLYLPWWLELHRASAVIGLPLSIADFERHFFLIDSGLPIEKCPLPILKLGRRATTNSVGSLISTLSSFFEYARANKNRYPDLARKVFDNPVVMGIDFPKGRRKGKTNKRIFTKKMMPYLLRYVYQIEKFGMHLQELQRSGKWISSIPLFGKAPPPNRNAVRQDETDDNESFDDDNVALDLPGVFYPSDFGTSLTVEFNNKSLPITSVPRIFQFSKRTIQLATGERRDVIIAHLSALRIVIGILETGLRGQALQWLDRRSWNSRNGNLPADATVVDLFVNTDKVKPDPYTVLIIKRVQELLQREETFQLSLFEDGMDTPVHYEGRENSRFSPVVPLFRARPKRHKGKLTGKPVADESYTRVWRKLLAGFQTFYNEEVLSNSDDFVELVSLKPCYPKSMEIPGMEVVFYHPKTRAPHYCPLFYQSKHTPHSGRATFISNRISILSHEFVGSLVGHESPRVTEHYAIREREELEQQVASISDYLWNFSSDDPAYIHAANANSALRRGFLKDRNATIKQQGFITISFFNGQDEEMKKDGIEILRTTPASDIAWFDMNVCPFGGQCPAEIMDVIIEPRRCGLCPYAVKGIDHLTAITAKHQSLLEQTVNATALLQAWQPRAEKGEISQDLLDQIDESRKLDLMEASAWRLTEQKLREAAEKLRNAGADETIYITDQPEFVARYFMQVSRKADRTQYVLERLRDAHEYVSLQTPELRMKANQMTQRILFNIKASKKALLPVPPGHETELLFSTIRHAVRSLGLKKEEVIALLSDPTIDERSSLRQIGSTSQGQPA